MKKTLLEIVQSILNEMDSDEVNSIDDTVESQQVALIVKGCYEEMIAHRDWPHLKKLIVLDSSLSLDRPTHLRTPDNLKELIFFKYNKQRGDDGMQKYDVVDYLHPDEFLEVVQTRNSKNEHTQTVFDVSGVPLLVLSNQPPTYWTSFDDDYIVCDSYQKDIEDTLQSSKTLVSAYMEPVWQHLDDSVPNLPSEAFPALVEESKSTAFLTLKQMTNQKAEQKAVRQNSWLARKAWKTAGGVRYDNYGRRSRK